MKCESWKTEELCWEPCKSVFLSSYMEGGKKREDIIPKHSTHLLNLEKKMSMYICACMSVGG